MDDLYALLGVAPDASVEELRYAYVEGIWHTHPDLGEGDEELAKRLTAAYAVLADPERRKMYDRRRRGEWKMTRSQRTGTSTSTPTPSSGCAACGPEPVDGVAVDGPEELIVFRNGSSGNVLCETCADEAHRRIAERGLAHGADGIMGMLSAFGFGIAANPDDKGSGFDGPAALD